MQSRVILILYTTLYREGGDKFKLVAQTMLHEKQIAYPDQHVMAVAVESKSEFVAALQSVRQQNCKIQELHFIGHSGVYGIMFGTTQWPEQFSPHEWRQMTIPFTDSAKAYFHACRTSRWFAPFFARTFAVKTFGYFWYTTVSAHPQKFVWQRYFKATDPCYIVSIVGKKSHGLLGSMAKYLRLRPVFQMQEFAGVLDQPDTSYDAVAQDYAKTFVDIKVRSDEWQWLMRQMKEVNPKTVLDVGCGNGALLREIAPLIERGEGVDASAGMIQEAQTQSVAFDNLSFCKISGPVLPFPDNSFDVVLSVLAFRYLDWDPITQEILRVLKPGGEIWVVDMVAAPVSWREWPFFFWSKLQQQAQSFLRRDFVRQLKLMVRSKTWQQMLKHNPIRAEHEYRWYFTSRFPKSSMSVINMGWHSRILAFRSGPVLVKSIAKQNYP